MENVAPAELSTTAAPVGRLGSVVYRLDQCHWLLPVKYMSQNLSVMFVISSMVKPTSVSGRGLVHHLVQALT
jgi:predicted Rdx family selenoprotein